MVQKLPLNLSKEIFPPEIQREKDEHELLHFQFYQYKMSLGNFYTVSQSHGLNTYQKKLIL